MIKEDKIWGWRYKPLIAILKLSDNICDDDDDDNDDVYDDDDFDDDVSISGPWQCYLGDAQCYLEKSKSIFSLSLPPKKNNLFLSIKFQWADVVE